MYCRTAGVWIFNSSNLRTFEIIRGQLGFLILFNVCNFFSCFLFSFNIQAEIKSVTTEHFVLRFYLKNLISTQSVAILAPIQQAHIILTYHYHYNKFQKNPLMENLFLTHVLENHNQLQGGVNLDGL